jgi:hypothetical protein
MRKIHVGLIKVCLLPCSPPLSGDLKLAVSPNLPLPFLHLKPLVSSTSPSISILSKLLSRHNIFLSISRLALSSFTFFFKNTISPFIYSTLTFFLTNPSNPTPILPIWVSQKAQTTIFLQLQHKTLITSPSQLGLKHLLFHHKPI